VRAQDCAVCHREIAEKFQRTGMARSFGRPSLDRDVTYYHQASDSYFSMLRRGGKIFQRRYQLDARGRQVNVMEKQVDYVMGSGNHSRAYLHRNADGTLIELPLAWYAEKGGYWAMNPGYDRPDHDGFRRPITYDCMFCHNAYPRIPAKPDQPVYEGELPQGIDCQRCHGPGAQHAQSAGRVAIANPARWSADRQLELCMVCHLETTSFPLPNAILRSGRAPFSYRPGEPLQNFILNFDHAPGTGREDKFEIVNAAYRLRRSACFVKSSGKLRCTTCHDPHDAGAPRDYNAVCRQCHTTAVKHGRDDGCVDCHMPRRRTEDVVHVVMTDHYIQRRKPAGDLLADRPERQDHYRGPVVLYYPATLPHNAENDLDIAVAQVKQGSNLGGGIAQLAAAIEKYKPSGSEYYLELAEALRNDGRLAESLPVYREAVRRDPMSAGAQEKLGAALRRAGQNAEAVEVLRRAVSIAPNVAVTWHELGQAYRAAGRNAEAIEAIRKALELDPDLPEAHNNLGILRLSEADFREAIRIRPDYADAHANLAGLLASSGQYEEAREQFEQALKLRPADAPTRYNYAMLLGRTNHFDEAQHELEESLKADPKFADAHQLLGDLLRAKGQLQNAIPHYREAVRLNPQSARAQLSLGAALAAIGDVSGAILHLQIAAGASDAAIRDRAAELLRKFK
jgi:predicted CXXCH cytochrome family protein